MSQPRDDLADIVRPLLRDGLSVRAVGDSLLVLDPAVGEVARFRCNGVDVADIIEALRARCVLDPVAEPTESGTPAGVSRRTLLTGAATVGTVGVTVLTLPSAAVAASPAASPAGDTSTSTSTTTTVPDGTTWTSRTSAADNDWTSVTYGTPGGNPLFVAVASSGTGNRVMTSPDGIDWTNRPTH
jgi:hypothetical protein